MRLPIFPNTGLYESDQDEQQPRKRLPDGNNLIKDFFTKPIPLPVWLWNIIVVAIYLSLLVFAVQLGLVILAGIILFVTNLL